MQKKQVVIKGLLFVLFGIIGFSSFTFAAIQSDPLTPIAGKPVSLTVSSPDPTIPKTITLPVDECMTKSQSDATNAQTGLGECKKKNSATDCQKQYDDQINMILATYKSCHEAALAAADAAAAAAACTACKTNFCAKETTSCDIAKTAAACQTECWTSSSTPGAVMWITINPECLKNGQCGLSIYDLLWMKGKNTSATIFVQDVLLSATLFIGTIITIALISSGLMYIMAGVDGKDPSKAKNGIIYSIIGLLLVISSYTIIRLVQYIAKGL